MIINILCKQIQNNPDKIALICGHNKLTYLELSQKVAGYSDVLSKIGVKSGSHIGLILKNSIEFVIIMLAAAHRGAVIVPLPVTLKPDALKKAVKASDIEFMLTEEDDIFKKAYCLDDLEPIMSCSKKDYIITMTSGSTGDPKPIIFSQDTKIKRTYSARDCYGLDENVVSLAATPLYHSLAQRLVLLPLLLGGTAVIMQNFSPKLWLENVIKHKVTFAIPVSSQLAGILAEYKKGSYKADSLKTLVSSSALISKELKQDLVDTFSCEIHEIYGASEVGVVTNLAPSDGLAKLGTVGKALPGIDIKIVDGEITCKTDTAFVGYYKKQEETKKAMAGGYFHTGDLGKLDKDGFLTFLGRKKDIIITGGINVYPNDIENVLMQTVFVKECAVIGIEDKRFGEAVLAVIVKKDPDKFDLSKLQQYCRGQLADYQQPLGYEILEELPKNNMGKVLKPKLRSKFAYLDLTKRFDFIWR